MCSYKYVVISPVYSMTFRDFYGVFMNFQWGSYEFIFNGTLISQGGLTTITSDPDSLWPYHNS